MTPLQDRWVCFDECGLSVQNTIQYWFWFFSYVPGGSPGSLDLLMIVCGVDDDHLQVLCWVPLRNVLVELLLYLAVRSFTERW